VGRGGSRRIAAQCARGDRGQRQRRIGLRRVAWEISIKVALGKLTVPADPAVWFPARVRSLGFQALDISAAHVLAVGGLPDVHRDPFDRIMIAQAQIEGLTLVTRDPDNQKYPINILEA
jgi:PIN domain nuclease of toxin-antitoxin system